MRLRFFALEAKSYGSVFRQFGCLLVDFWRKIVDLVALIAEILCADDGYGVIHSLFSDSLSIDLRQGEPNLSGSG